MKKVIHNTDIQRNLSNFHHKYTHDIHALRTNFNKFFNINKSFFKII